MKLSTRVKVYTVQVYQPKCTAPRFYEESLSFHRARELARNLSILGMRATVRRFDISADELAKLPAGSRSPKQFRVVPRKS